MCRNSDIAELKETSSKSLIDKLKMFEINRRKLAKSRQNYGIQEVTSPNKEADLTCLGAAQDKGDKAVAAQRDLTTIQSKQKEADVATKGVNKPVPRLDEIHNQRDLIANQSELKKCDVATKKLKTSVTKKLDFSHLRSTFDRIGCRVKTMSERVGERQNTPRQQPENLESNHNNTMPATNALQEPSSANSAQITRNIDQQNNTQVPQDEFPLFISEREVPQADEGILEQEGSRKGKSKAVLRASTIDEFLKENGMEMELEGLIQDGLGTEPQSDVGETLALDKDYSPHVMADIVVDEGTLGRNKRVVSLCYTSWVAVPPEKKKFMWDYTNTKFILPENTEKWVVQSVRDAWKHFKGKIKQKHFLPYDNVEDMMKNRPMQTISEKNKEHSRQQKYPHRMGPINFSRVRAALREANEANEEPKRFEDVFESRQASGETEEEAFQSLFGKEQPRWVRCYGRSITQIDLRKHADVSAIKQQHQEEVSTLQSRLGDMQTQQQQQAEEIHGLRKMVKLLLLQFEPEMRPEEADALLQDAQHSPVDANSAHGSTRAPNMGVENVGDIQED
ncbi:hypothetical protein PIB30_086641 [Stylosanthes scabra]|uniref:Transposase n=1 Tax=Stylosanthes scabra TaxID=79078 RepID=A0ABU6TV56_9FABA|nr:hypothetical protein [Stylosanthes scabra]